MRYLSKNVYREVLFYSFFLLFGNAPGFALLNTTYEKCPKEDQNIIKVLAEEHHFLQDHQKWLEEMLT